MILKRRSELEFFSKRKFIFCPMLNRSLKLRAIIVGTDDECNQIRRILCTSDRFEIIGNVIPNSSVFLQQISEIKPDLIINASADPAVDEFLKKIKSPNCSILSALNAELLFCSAIPESNKSNAQNFRSKVLHGLKEIGHTVHLTKDVNECLTLILSVAINSLNADSGSIMLTDPTRRMLRIEIAHGIDENIISSTKQKIGKGIAGKVAYTGKPILLNGAQESEKYSSVSRNDIISSLSVPLLINKQAIGVLNINSKCSGKIFDYDDLKYAADLAQFAAGVIDSSREFQKSKQISATYSLLTSTNDILHLNYSLQERLNLLMMKLVNSMNGKICNLYKFDKESKSFFIQASSYYDLNRRYTQMIRLNDFFTGRSLRCRQQFTFTTSFKKLSFQKCFIAQPIFSNKQISGLLLLQKISNQNHLETEKKLLGKVASYLEREFSQLSIIEGTRLNSIRCSAFSEIAYDISTIHNVRNIAKMIVVNTCLLFEADNCILSLYNEVMTCFEVLESFSLKSQAHIKLLENLDKLITSQVMKHNSPVLVPDLSSVSFIDLNTPFSSVISVCLRQNGKIIGALSIYGKSKYNIHDQSCFTSHDKELFNSYSLQVARMLNRFLCIK